MRRRLAFGLLVLILLSGIAACGSGNDSTFGVNVTTTLELGSEPASALAALAFRAVTGQLGSEAAEPSDTQTTCIASRLGDQIGEARAAELQAVAAGTSDIWEVASQMHDPEVTALVDAILSCLDTASMFPGKSDMLTCLAPLFEGDGLENLVRAVITGMDYPTIRDFNQANNLCVLGGLVGVGG